MIPVYDQNPTSKPAVVTKWLITLNISIHFIRWLGGDAGLRLTESWSFIPAELSQTPAAGLLHAFTALFLHADIFHLITNMIFLHVFGDNIEDILGKRRYLVFYLLSGLGATLTHYWMDPHSTLPLIGASGAIAGILAGYLVVYPRAPVVVINPVFLLWFIFGPLLLLPAWLVIGLFFITNISRYNYQDFNVLITYIILEG